MLAGLTYSLHILKFPVYAN